MAACRHTQVATESDRQSRAAVASANHSPCSTKAGTCSEVRRKLTQSGAKSSISPCSAAERQRALELLLDRRPGLVEGPLPLLARVAEGDTSRSQRSAVDASFQVPRPSSKLSGHPRARWRWIEGWVSMVTSSYSVARRRGRSEPAELALGRFAGRRRRRRGSGRVGRGREPVGEDPAPGRRRVRSASPRRRRASGRPAHVDVGDRRRRRLGERRRRSRARRRALGSQPRARISSSRNGSRAPKNSCTGRSQPSAASWRSSAEHRRHPRAAGDHQDRPLGPAQAKRAVGPGDAELVARDDLGAEAARQPAVRVALDHQLDRVRVGPVRDVGDRERAGRRRRRARRRTGPGAR